MGCILLFTFYLALLYVRVQQREELEVADEAEEEDGGSAYYRQRADRGKGRGVPSKKKAASIAGRRRRATSAKQQSRVYDPGITG